MLSCQANNSETNISNQVTAQSVKNNTAALTNRTMQGWKLHFNDVKSKGELQKGCEPYYKLAKGNVKGSVMLFHGYSSCPQQYDELSVQLADKGYNVFIHLLPGHGKIANKIDGKFTDESSGLPDVDSTIVYKNFAKNVAAILKDEPELKYLEVFLWVVQSLHVL